MLVLEEARTQEGPHGHRPLQRRELMVTGYVPAAAFAWLRTGLARPLVAGHRGFVAFRSCCWSLESAEWGRRVGEMSVVINRPMESVRLRCAGAPHPLATIRIVIGG